jgi:hypothetical protein
MDMSDPGSSPSSQWAWTEPRYATTPGVDPELEWALGSGKDTFFAGGRQQRWMPVMVELQGITVAEFAAGTGFLDDGPSRTMWQASIRVSPVHEGIEDGASDIAYCTAMVKQGFFEFLRQSETLKKTVVGITLGLPIGAESLGPTIPVNNSGHTQP